ncbi:MAG TPA: histidine kinase dimerization/phospho-acceptor domain-containing protein, partial [Chloroflexota bacterium]
MDGVERATLAAHLRQQAAALTAAWQHAIATTSFANFDRDEVRQQLTSLTDQLITILLDDAAPATGAQEIGAGVARLHYVQPEALGQTQAVLAQHLLPAIRGERRGRLELRLVLLLSELGTGFSRQVRSMLLSEQETIRAAFLQELNKAALTQAQQYASAEQARGELRAVLDAATDGMLLISHERRVLAVKRRYEELLGLPAATILGRNMADIREDLERIFEDLPALSRNMDRVANTEQRATLVLRQRWPERRELQLFSTPVRRADGTILGRLHTFRDVTQERAVQRMKDEFVGLVSHELRTPLTSIKGYVDLLLAGDVGDLTEEQREFLTIVQRNADREVTLVNDLLDLSRLEAGDLEILLAPL